ncbi:hypothetical protein GCM10029976_098320 [Kribbella albertanoniae]|uniref:TPR repeat domain-containing protein n=1 Tax=Kribbella albertanoniae TaxID=1266829 RepID=A0A4V2XMJ3_9ACTN|nr:hypothetical protein [Kribbella albertanoniae]TDC14536.1 hypothetical protein E1261_42490 [Kribbella albertanoniae]
MARKEDGGQADGLCMIDHVILGGVISDLVTMESAIGTELKGLKAEFAKVGVSVQPLTDLTNVANWLHGELPMLRRRHAAAVLLASQGMPFSPGSRLISLPEDPATASTDAGNLAAEQVRSGLDGKPGGREGLAAALRAVQLIRLSRGGPSPDDVNFLEAFYEGLGRDVYKVPGYLKDDSRWTTPLRPTYTPVGVMPDLDAGYRAALTESVVGGLLHLSDERRGGSWNRLPEFVRKAACDPWHYPMSPVAMGGQKAAELAAFLSHGDDRSSAGVAFSKQLAITVSESAEALRSIRPPIDDVIGRTFLAVAGRNEQAMHDLLTNRSMGMPAEGDANLYAGYKGPHEFLTPLTTHAWSDEGKAVSTVFDWIADAKQSKDPQRQALARQAMQGLVTTLADPAVLNRVLDIEWSGREAVGAVNPEIARSLARDAAAFLTEFSDPAAKVFTSTAPKMDDGQVVGARFFTLVATDRSAAEALAGSIYRYNVNGIRDELAHPGHVTRHAGRAAQLDIMMNSALHIAALEHTVDKELAAAEASAIRGKALGIVNEFIELGPLGDVRNLPGVDPVDISDRILGRFINSDTGAVDPQQIRTEGVDTRATAAHLLLIHYNITKALVESGKLDVHQLAPDMRSSGVPPRLLSPADFRENEYFDLIDAYKAETGKVPGGTSLADAYIKTYTPILAKDNERYLADNPAGLKNKLGIG